MQFALVIIGLILIVSGARDTYAALGKELSEDAQDFMPWIVALGGVGMMGYVPQMKPFSRAFIVLIFIVMIIRNGGFFDKFNEALALGPSRPGDNALDVTPTAKAALENFDASDYGVDYDEARANFGKTVDVIKTLFL